ncbi:hypothetical protein ABPG75_012185 [Micractinium tetrahymenae]
MAARFEFGNLPGDVLDLLLRQLNTVDRVALAACSTTLRELCSAPGAWRSVQLAVPAARLERLRPWLAARKSELRLLELSIVGIPDCPEFNEQHSDCFSTEPHGLGKLGVRAADIVSAACQGGPLRRLGISLPEQPPEGCLNEVKFEVPNGKLSRLPDLRRLALCMGEWESFVSTQYSTHPFWTELEDLRSLVLSGANMQLECNSFPVGMRHLAAPCGAWLYSANCPPWGELFVTLSSVHVDAGTVESWDIPDEEEEEEAEEDDEGGAWHLRLGHLAHMVPEVRALSLNLRDAGGERVPFCLTETRHFQWLRALAITFRAEQAEECTFLAALPGLHRLCLLGFNGEPLPSELSHAFDATFSDLPSPTPTSLSALPAPTTLALGLDQVPPTAPLLAGLTAVQSLDITLCLDPAHSTLHPQAALLLRQLAAALAAGAPPSLRTVQLLHPAAADPFELHYCRLVLAALERGLGGRALAVECQVATPLLESLRGGSLLSGLGEEEEEGSDAEDDEH